MKHKVSGGDGSSLVGSMSSQSASWKRMQEYYGISQQIFGTNGILYSTKLDHPHPLKRHCST